MINFFRKTFFLIVFLAISIAVNCQPPNNPNRPCDTPPCKGGNGGGNGCFPPPCVPIDNGIVFLLVAGTMLGAKRYTDSKRVNQQ